MGIRGELFTTQVLLDNRTYFFNVKENRVGDVFLQIVESKKGDGADFDRHQISIFAEDMQKVLAGLDDSLKFIEKDRRKESSKRSKIRLWRRQENHQKDWKRARRNQAHWKSNSHQVKEIGRHRLNFFSFFCRAVKFFGIFI